MYNSVNRNPLCGRPGYAPAIVYALDWIDDIATSAAGPLTSVEFIAWRNRRKQKPKKM